MKQPRLTGQARSTRFSASPCPLGRADPDDRHHLSAPWRRSRPFDLAYILTSQPTTEVISIRLYKMAFQEWQTGMSCALAYIVLIMVLAITNIYVKYLNKVKER